MSFNGFYQFSISMRSDFFACFYFFLVENIFYLCTVNNLVTKILSKKNKNNGFKTEKSGDKIFHRPF